MELICLALILAGAYYAKCVYDKGFENKYGASVISNAMAGISAATAFIFYCTVDNHSSTIWIAVSFVAMVAAFAHMIFSTYAKSKMLSGSVSCASQSVLMQLLLTAGYVVIILLIFAAMASKKKRKRGRR